MLARSLAMFAAVTAAALMGCDRDPEEQAWDPEPVYPSEAIPRGDLAPDIVVDPSDPEGEAPPRARESWDVPSPGPEPEDVY